MKFHKLSENNLILLLSIIIVTIADLLRHYKALSHLHDSHRGMQATKRRAQQAV